MSIAEEYHNALNRLAKWRTAFAGWQLGTRLFDDPECQAVRDQRELLLLLRVELSALTTLMTQKQVFSCDEMQAAIIVECEYMHKLLEEKFPGFKATETGLTIDPVKARDTMKGWPK